MVKRSRRRPAVRVTGDGTRLVNHAGTRLVADMAEKSGLTSALSAAMAATKQRQRGHDRGDVLVDVAVMLADGGERISDVDILRDQPDLFGEVASHATVWRTLQAIDAPALERIKTARAQARAALWAAGVDPGFYVIDIDATLIGSHSDKEQAAPTYKKGFGFHPLMAYLDATGEALAGLLRPGNAGSGTASDHKTVLDDALAQLPIDPTKSEVIVRSDSAGWSHGLVEHCRSRNVNFVIGHRLTIEIANILVEIPENKWEPTISPDGTEWRDHGKIVEVTHLAGSVFDTTRNWPSGLRIIARREVPHEGAQLTYTDLDGHRYQVFITDLDTPDIAYLEALYRGRGRAEQQICDTKTLGLSKLPSHTFAINHAWVQLALIAHDLLAWTKTLTLTGDLATAQPKRLRYTLLHTAGIIATTGRKRFCRLSQTWPWTEQLVDAFHQLDTIHHKT